VTNTRQVSLNEVDSETVRVKATYDRAGLFVWHCHIVEHEDHEMMRPYRSVPNRGSPHAASPIGQAT
jgi:FtsP/CotA-like multicopper oxidase with cupredoxin domain